MPGPCPDLPVPVAASLTRSETLPGGPWVPRVPPGTQVPNGSQRTVNGPLTDPLAANGRIRPLTVSGVRELRPLARRVEAPGAVRIRHGAVDRPIHKDGRPQLLLVGRLPHALCRRLTLGRPESRLHRQGSCGLCVGLRPGCHADKPRCSRPSNPQGRTPAAPSAACTSRSRSTRTPKVGLHVP